MIQLTNQQARQFIMLKQGLIGEYKFIGKQGVLEYIRQTGCIQFDPVDSCGKNAELVLQSRVKGFEKKMLEELLYSERDLFDFPDKNLSIIPKEDWPYFERYRHAAEEGGLCFQELAELEIFAKTYISQNGAISANELPLDGKLYWHSFIHWSGNWGGTTKAARAVLEQLYSSGTLIIHHKIGARKYYDLAEKYLPASLLSASEPIIDNFQHQKWRILRRIGAVGLMWNRPSDAWLNIWELKSSQRNQAFAQLLEEGKIIAVQVEDMKDKLFCRAEDLGLIEVVIQKNEFEHRCEFLAPLDCFLWDRKLIKTLFDFDYKWEIYTPMVKRKYGFYVLPIIYGEKFVGRIEAINDRKSKTLIVKNLWYEGGINRTELLNSAIKSCIIRFAKFNNCDIITFVNSK